MLVGKRWKKKGLWVGGRRSRGVGHPDKPAGKKKGENCFGIIGLEGFYGSGAQGKRKGKEKNVQKPRGSREDSRGGQNGTLEAPGYYGKQKKRGGGGGEGVVSKGRRIKGLLTVKGIMTKKGTSATANDQKKGHARQGSGGRWVGL